MKSRRPQAGRSGVMETAGWRRIRLENDLREVADEMAGYDKSSCENDQVSKGTAPEKWRKTDASEFRKG